MLLGEGGHRVTDVNLFRTAYASVSLFGAYVGKDTLIFESYCFNANSSCSSNPGTKFLDTLIVSVVPRYTEPGINTSFYEENEITTVVGDSVKVYAYILPLRHYNDFPFPTASGLEKNDTTLWKSSDRSVATISSFQFPYNNFWSAEVGYTSFF
ncbi:MAG: hypothetical protein GX801_10575 [Fibrobacter sp.]|nr:hypothetical protein [Fibrobacter sp.]